MTGKEPALSRPAVSVGAGASRRATTGFLARKTGWNESCRCVHSEVCYGFNPELGKAHFLGNKGNDWKNCGYHMHVMQLLSAILPRLPQSERAGFTKVRASLGVSVVDFIVSAYQVKAGEGLGGDSKTQTNGAFGSCGEKAKTPLSPAVISALSGL